MFFVILHPNGTNHSRTFEKSKVQNPIREVLALFRVKVMALLRMSKKEKGWTRMLKLRGKPIDKRSRSLSSLIRIQLEDIKGKVRALSPAALQFIGPGDR